MILLHIGSSDEKQAWEIVDFLESEKLIVDVVVMNGSSRINKTGDKKLQPHHLILGKTKALLFDKIDKAVKKKHQDNIPSIYSTPIVNMDWDQRIEIQEKTTKV